MELHAGQVISAPFLPARAEVKQFQRRTGYCLLEVVLEDGHHTYQTHRISDEQLAQVAVCERSGLQPAASAEDFFFLIEANRIRLAYQFDPQLAVSVSQVDPLPHQIEAVYRHVLESPRIRFLIADDPGAGKTIMAGLIFKELQYRRLVKRVLIVAPGHLKYQWQREMKERFQESFAIVDRARMRSAWGENVWDERDHCITSLDFVKQDEIRSTLRSSHWDLVIVDEAHKMSAYAYRGQKRTKIRKTKRYQVGEVLSKQTEHLLFLTATPHRGDPENFRLFLDLLRPGFFAQVSLLRESVQNEDNPIFVRRLKEDMYTFDGKPIFPPRHVQTVPFRLAADEAALYNDVTHYVRDYYARAKDNRSITFALMILQRRLTSSTYAILESLKRRKGRLEEFLARPVGVWSSEDYLRSEDISEDDLEEMADDELAEIERRVEHLTIARNRDDLQAEIDELDRLIGQAERVREQEIESKLVGLRDVVLKHLGERKLLIFTEFKDTLDYLAGDGRGGRPLGKLIEWGYIVTTIHGQMTMDARIVAEHEFRDHSQIMVATEAAGEGINLQFCSLMVNYDIPWNPNRLEQRMGRIHRYGQQLEVWIWNMVCRDTREGQILERLFTKLQTMSKDLGDRVFDVIGEIIPGGRLDELLRDAIFNQRRMDEIEQHIDAVGVEEAKQTLDRVFLTGLATRHIDYSGLLKETLAAEENRLVPEYVGDYFLRAFQRLGGRIEKRDGLYTVRGVPFELRQWGNDYDFKTTYGKLFREYKRVTFEKTYARKHPEAEFVAPGHPLLEAVNEQILATMGNGGRTAVFGDPEGRREGVLWFVEGEVSDGTGQAAGKRVFCLYQALDGTVSRVNPAILWDYEPLDEPSPQALPAADGRLLSSPSPLPSPSKGEGERRSACTSIDWVSAEIEGLLRKREEIEDYVIVEVLMPFRDEIAARREREAAVKEKYGLRSMDYLMQESNQKILDYQMRQGTGEAVDLPLLNEQRNLDELQQRRAELEREIRLERNLTVGEPRFLGAAAVVPLGRQPEPDEASEGFQYEANRTRTLVNHDERGGYDVMHRDPEIEAVGMWEAMTYERGQGWQVEDVSGENLGFDVRSTLYSDDGTFGDIRYVEVKARARTGGIRLSANEWKKARHFGDKFWLYVVTEAGTDMPELHRIQHPAAKFAEGEDIFATGFIIPEERWRGRV